MYLFKLMPAAAAYYLLLVKLIDSFSQLTGALLLCMDLSVRVEAASYLWKTASSLINL